MPKEKGNFFFCILEREIALQRHTPKGRTPHSSPLGKRIFGEAKDKKKNWNDKEISGKTHEKGAKVPPLRP